MEKELAMCFENRNQVEAEIVRVQDEMRRLFPNQMENACHGSHMADNSSSQASTAVKRALLIQHGKELERLTTVLNLMSRGEYGICVVCGKQISKKRLDAKPDATACLPCQEEFEKGR